MSTSDTIIEDDLLADSGLDTFDFAATYTADGWSDGIAWRAFDYLRDEEYEWHGGIDQQLVDTSKIQAHMVGDDQVFIFNRDELTTISEDDYCPECGQVGCTAYGLIGDED